MQCYKPIEKVCMDAMHDLMQTKRLDRITAQDILAATGISKATFYRYYKDKNELFEKMIWRDVNFIFTSECSLAQWRTRVVQFSTRLKQDKALQYKLARDEENAFKNFYANIMYELFLKRLYRLRDKQQFVMTRELKYRLLYMSGGAATLIYEWIMSGCPDS
ncbi:MAG: TetR/AcrR family transcriptional regulator, partial [Angelakisella sp.]